MKLVPSHIDLLLERIEKERPDLLPIVMQAIKDEKDRWDRGDYTDSEKLIFQSIQKAAERSATIVHDIILSSMITGGDK